MDEFDKAEAAYLREDELEDQETASTLKSEWMDNWLETEPVTNDIVWAAVNEVDFDRLTVITLCYDRKDIAMLGYHVAKMIEEHMQTLAGLAYDERMT
jgi:hypothetical protein